LDISARSLSAENQFQGDIGHPVLEGRRGGFDIVEQQRQDEVDPKSMVNAVLTLQWWFTKFLHEQQYWQHIQR